MISKKSRVPRKLFKPIIEKGKYSNTSHFSLRAAQGEEESARIAVSVSKKITKSAVDRNKIRRRAYSAAGEMLGEIKPGLYLIITKKGVENIKGEGLKKELKELFSKFLISN